MIVSARNKLLNWLVGSKNSIVEINFDVKGRTFKAYVPDDQYWGSIKDVLLNREYEYFTDFELERFTGLVVDAGAHVGLFSLISSIFARYVVAIEPHPANFRLLKRNFEKNKVSNAFALNKALYSRNKQRINLYEGADSGCNSVIKGSNLQYIVANSITLQQIIEDFGNIDLLKIDVEGAEFEIFRNIEKNYLTRINAIVGEIHSAFGRKDKIFEELNNKGFSIRTLYPPLLKKGGRYLINVNDLRRLKLIRGVLYTVSPIARAIDKSLLIFFAKRK